MKNGFNEVACVKNEVKGYKLPYWRLVYTGNIRKEEDQFLISAEGCGLTKQSILKTTFFTFNNYADCWKMGKLKIDKNFYLPMVPSGVKSQFVKEIFEKCVQVQEDSKELSMNATLLKQCLAGGEQYKTVLTSLGIRKIVISTDKSQLIAGMLTTMISHIRHVEGKQVMVTLKQYKTNKSNGGNIIEITDQTKFAMVQQSTTAIIPEEPISMGNRRNDRAQSKKRGKKWNNKGKSKSKANEKKSKSPPKKSNNNNTNVKNNNNKKNK